MLHIELTNHTSALNNGLSLQDSGKILYILFLHYYKITVAGGTIDSQQYWPEQYI